jgi:hypothetical protein
MNRLAMSATLKENWFWPLALLLLGCVAWINWSMSVRVPEQWEFAIVFDALVTVPLLFFLCYRKRRSAAHLAGRIIALQCLGIWIASKLVPADHQLIIPYLSWLRNAGLAILLLIEIRLAFILFKLIFKPDTTNSQLEESGVPPLLAKLALLEIRFWRWVFGVFRR